MLSQRKGKRLPNGKLDDFAAETGKSHRELKYRMQLASKYATEEELGTAVPSFESWTQVRESLTANTEPEPDAALVECEAVIERGLRSFVEVGQALARIRDERLYKAEFATFEEYCRERWDISRPRAYQLLEASKQMDNLSTIVDKSHLPATESQARELCGLEPGEAQEVMQAAHEATQGKITAKAIKKARE